MAPEIVPTHPAAAGPLTEIALRSKAYWGYDEAFMAACAAEMRVLASEIENQIVRVAEIGAEIAGFYTLGPDGEGGGEVHKFFVSPDFIGYGIGRILFEDLCRQADLAGFSALSLDSDPNAQGFYERMGFTVIGEVPSGSVPGRMLPRMCRPVETIAPVAP